MLECFAALHGLDQRRVDVYFTIIEDLVVNSICIFSRLLLLECVDLNALQFRAEIAIHYEFVLVLNVFLDRPCLLHNSWFVG